MGETGRTSSLLVHILVIALCLTAFGFAIAAERRRSTVLPSSTDMFLHIFFPLASPSVRYPTASALPSRDHEPRISGSEGFP